MDILGDVSITLIDLLQLKQVVDSLLLVSNYIDNGVKNFTILCLLVFCHQFLLYWFSNRILFVSMLSLFALEICLGANNSNIAMSMIYYLCCRNGHFDFSVS